MLVVLINESEGKAWKRTRRILAKYLPQIGSRVWAGHISEEGLINLHQDIKKVVSKSGSVACHRMMSRNRMELQWIAGQKDLYDEQGRYAFRTTQATKDYTSQPQGPYGELLYLTRCLAALLHDIGKATLAFQGKMHGIYHHEEYRHDLVGFLMLRSRFAPDNKPQDEYFLTELEKQDNLWPDSTSLFIMPDTIPNLLKEQLALWLQEAPRFHLNQLVSINASSSAGWLKRH
jgi:CRISPR-associated endonuclease/helicase Cas3